MQAGMPITLVPVFTHTSTSGVIPMLFFIATYTQTSSELQFRGKLVSKSVT